MKNLKLHAANMLSVAAALLLLNLTSVVADDRPNVLMILVDDLKPTLGCYQDTTAKTPNIDALAARGMRFDLAYCNQAVCAPSRFTLMLGSHSTSTGLYGLGSQLRQVMPDAVTMPQYFAKHGGYRTESLGKVFHIGHGNQGDPESFSVPHYKEKVIEYVDPASTQGGKLTREEAYFTNQQLGNVNSLPRGAAYESPDVVDESYADGRVAMETVRRLQAAKSRLQKSGTPFFIVAGFARPHLPFSAPKKYWELYDPASLPMPKFEDLPANAPTVAGKRGGEIRNYFPVPDKGDPETINNDLKRKLIHGYYASTSFVDAQIGKVVSELDRLELADDTIIVLWGDHGFHLGDLGIWTKHTNYEQANRIPLLVAAPGITKPRSSTRQLTESVDIFPTLAELAGLPAPQGPQSVDGVSLVPVLKNPDARVRDHAYHAYPKRKLGRAIRTQRYRLVQWQGFGAPIESAEYELYDYQADPQETRNLAADNPDVVMQLRKTLAKYPRPIGRNAKPKPATKAVQAKTPVIANRPLTITGRVSSTAGGGVIVAQGGDTQGYAVHILQRRLAFDVRVNGKVTRVVAKDTVPKEFEFEAKLTAEQLTLSVDGRKVAEAASPGLIPVQPIDGMNVGRDELTAAGDYEAPNPFRGNVASLKVTPGQRKKTTRPIQSELITQWGAAVTPQNAWTEYPRPQLKRRDWTNLNGEWEYTITPADQNSPPAEWTGKILVPFSLESKLSGVQRLLDAEEALWYRRTFEAKPSNKQRRLLNFEAVDYRCEVFVNGKSVGKHQGGNTPFAFDITPALENGANELIVRVEDDTEEYQLNGKQRRDPKGIFYTQVSGIWQTVWLETVPKTFIQGLHIDTDVGSGSIDVRTDIIAGDLDAPPNVKITAYFDGREVASATGSVKGTKLQIPNARLWSPDTPHLYQLKVELRTGNRVLDTVDSYTGIRSVGKAKDADGHWHFTLNDKKIFHWGPLDQGWWPDGLLTPPADEAMVFEIDWLKRAGFNMIRKHIKVEPRRYYYHCDRLGMLVWQDQVSGGPSPKWHRLDPERDQTHNVPKPGDPIDAQWPDVAHEQWMAELKGMIDHLYSHPSIVVWAPFNEAWGQHRTMEVGEWITKYDPSRSINIASGGNFAPVGDVADMHSYPHPVFPFHIEKYDDYVKVIGEFGGHGWAVDGHQWDNKKKKFVYGKMPKTIEEYQGRYAESIRLLSELKRQGAAAGVYTQTTDVEGEVNGLMTYDRKVIKIPAKQLTELHKVLFDEPSKTTGATQ